MALIFHSLFVGNVSISRILIRKYTYLSFSRIPLEIRNDFETMVIDAIADLSTTRHFNDGDYYKDAVRKNISKYKSFSTRIAAINI